MQRLRDLVLARGSLPALLFPAGLWVLLWLGVQAGLVENIKSGDPKIYLNSFRGTLPLWAGYIALVVFAVKFYRQRSEGISFFGPLGLATVYGLAGLAASLFSPDGTEALYWAGLYLSVPLVLWSIVWGKDGLGTIHRIINLNWLVLILAGVVLFVVALLYLDLGKLILSPSSWFECSLYRNWNGHTWHGLSSGFLKPTGVGRYAALAAILALGGLWGGRWRWLWASVLAICLILLLTSGARGAFIGFAAAVILITLLYGGKKAAVWGGLCIAVLVPVVLSTGVYSQFVDFCIVRTDLLSTPNPQKPVSLLELQLLELPLRVTVPEGRWVLEQVSPEELAALDVSGSAAAETGSPLAGTDTTAIPQPNGEESASSIFPRVLVPQGLLVVQIVTSQEQATTDPAARIGLPSGFWQLKALPKRDIANGEQPLRLRVDPGVQSLQPLGPGESLDLGRLVQVLTDPSFASISGRTSVWSSGYRLFKERPILGHGFQADRLLLGTHMHNTLMHALVQTGLIGTIPLILALVYGWLLVARTLPNRANLPGVHPQVFIQVSGVLIFFTFRAFSESTGAFFGVDWLLLAPILVYLQVVNRFASKAEDPSELQTKVNAVSWKPLVSWLRKSPSV